ncbi:gp44 [Mycobacterium phage Che9c]|uniref:Uncharacterized protein n=1 Tax=Mycobacterium phage Che9c TaxID=2907832 RepID=Q854V4_9CAUD|nr:gp44 [Mycobacterium phage Che9c]AAN12604.1 hypothetical protein PBI_CHE9C_44 [Mycobacterium phage Che9c]
MKHSTERIFDARDAEAIKLLKTDPDAFFEKKRKQPFGFAVPADKQNDENSSH